MYKEWNYEKNNNSSDSNWQDDYTEDEMIDALARMFESVSQLENLPLDPQKMERFDAEIERARQLAEVHRLKLTAEISDDTVGVISLSGVWLPFYKNKDGEPWVSLCNLIDGSDDINLYCETNYQELELFYDLGTEPTDSAAKE